MSVRLKELMRERKEDRQDERWNKNCRRRQQVPPWSVYNSVCPEWDILDLYVREASQRAVSPDCS